MQPAINDHETSRRRHIFGFGSLIALALVLVAITLNVIHASKTRDRAAEWQVHSMEVLLAIEQLRSSANEALRGERGYLIVTNPHSLSTYHKGIANSAKALDRVKLLMQDDPRQKEALVALDRQLARFLNILRHTMTLKSRGREAEAVALVRTNADRGEIENLLEKLDRIEGKERTLLAERNAANAAAAFRSDVADYGLVGIASIILLIVLWVGLTASKARTITLDMQAALRRAATVDDLTGLLNRRAFLAALDVEIARARRTGSPLALAVIDLDLFKSVNDRFGHAGGDEVLRKFADTARDAMRATDQIGRLGGEEFAVLMPDTDFTQSGMACERLRLAFGKRRIVLKSGALLHATISVGVAHLADGEARDRLITRADEALYDAKESGRNRTRLAA